jgi:hypothetical protein
MSDEQYSGDIEQDWCDNLSTGDDFRERTIESVCQPLIEQENLKPVKKAVKKHKIKLRVRKKKTPKVPGKPRKKSVKDTRIVLPTRITFTDLPPDLLQNLRIFCTTHNLRLRDVFEALVRVFSENPSWGLGVVYKHLSRSKK